MCCKFAKSTVKAHNDDDDDFVSRVVKSFANLQVGNNLGQPTTTTTTTTKTKLPQMAPQVMKYVANFEGVNRNYKCELSPHTHTHYFCATFFLFLLTSLSFSYVRHLIGSPSNCE